MATLTELLSSPGLPALVPLTEPSAGRCPATIWLAEQAAHLDAAPADSFAILSAAASEPLVGYRLDVALRRAGTRDVAVLGLVGGPTELAGTSRAIAERYGLGVVSIPADADIAALVIAIGREIIGGAEAHLFRLVALSERLARLESAGSDPATLVSEAELIIGTALDVRRQDDAITGIGAEPPHLRLATRIVADAVARRLQDDRRSEEVPLRSTAQVAAELLLGTRTPGDALLGRARALGIAIDGWHVVARLEVDDTEPAKQNDPVAEFELLDDMLRLLLRVARAGGGTWHATRVEDSLVLLLTERGDPGSAGVARAKAALGLGMGRLGSQHPELRVRCGIGGSHEGWEGIRASAAEARAALATARARSISSEPIVFDATGLRRILIEWASTESARQTVAELLAPLDRLGGRRAETAIRTLRVYLDARGSLVAAARTLDMHPNSVAYRMERIRERLAVDIDDPGARLALELACQARLISSPT